MGKRTLHVPNAGELSSMLVSDILYDTFKLGSNKAIENIEDAPEAPMRPPVLCAGCPHRASFYAVKRAMKGKKAVFCGDIGCYTLGNAQPLDMTDTCLCMGAGITVAQGLYHAEPDCTCFAFAGDSTFFASGITGVVNAVYNKSDLVLIVLDNSTTAMTGHQPHPGIGKTMMNEVTEVVSIKKVLQAVIGEHVYEANPLDLNTSIQLVKDVSSIKGVKAILFKSPCIALMKDKQSSFIETDACIGCKKCINELGCPAIHIEDKKAVIDEALCTGCNLCSQVCPTECIKGGMNG